MSSQTEELEARARAQENVLVPLYKREQDAYVRYAQALHADALAFERWLRANPDATTKDVVAQYEISHAASRRAQNEFIELFTAQDARMSKALGIEPLRLGF